MAGWHSKGLAIAATLWAAGMACACGDHDADADGLAGTGQGGSAGATVATGGSAGGSAGSGATGGDSPGLGGGAGGPVSENPEVSECGGFDSGFDSGFDKGLRDYCGAERLRWSYDEQSQRLSLTDARVQLNCCGEHSIHVDHDTATGAYRIVEIDAPEDIGGEPMRCNCLCVFDFRTEVVNVPSGVVSASVIRHVTDVGDPETIWQGEIDLSAGSGEVVLDDTPLDYGCSG